MYMRGNSPPDLHKQYQTAKAYNTQQTKHHSRKMHRLGFNTRENNRMNTHKELDQKNHNQK